MAYDKVVDSAFLETGLKKVGDSIRAKAGTSELLEFPDAMSAAVDAIDTSENLDDVLDDQESLIDQIKAALEGKAGVSVETVEVTLVGVPGFSTANDLTVWYLESLEASAISATVPGDGSVAINVIKGSLISVLGKWYGVTTNNVATQLAFSTGTYIFLQIQQSGTITLQTSLTPV